MKRIRVDVEELVGEWKGPVTNTDYVVPILNKIILIYTRDRNALLKEYGSDKLPII